MFSRRQCMCVCCLLALAACSRDKPVASRQQLPTDTALANDLHRAAAASSAYGDAADIAMAPIPDSELDRPPQPVRLRVVATSPVRAPDDVERRAPAPPQAQSPTPSRVQLPLPPQSQPPVSQRAQRTLPPQAQPALPSEVPPSTNSCDSPAADDQRRCLMSYLARSDVGLDRTYQSLIAALDQQAGVGPGDPPPATVTQLRQAQRAWLVYRDTECRRRNRRNEGPLWAPVRARCLGEFSRDREQELSVALARMGGR